MRKKIIRITKRIIFTDALQKDDLKEIWQDAFFTLFSYAGAKPGFCIPPFDSPVPLSPTHIYMNNLVSGSISSRLNEFFNYCIPSLINEEDKGTLRYSLPTLSFQIPAEVLSFNPSAIEDFGFAIELTTKPLIQIGLIEGNTIQVTENLNSLRTGTQDTTSPYIITIPIKSDLKISAYHGI